MPEKPLTTGEVANYCHVTYRAVLKWIAAGKLKAYRTPGQHSRVRAEDFLHFLKEYNMPIPEGLLERNRKRRILIVDDDKEMVNAMKRFLLLEKQFQIEAALDGFTAGQKFAEFAPGLIILDIKMPGMDGYEVCSQIRKDPNNKNVKILAISGVIDIDGAERILALGANDYLSKPFKNVYLKLKIERLLGMAGRTGSRDD